MSDSVFTATKTFGQFIQFDDSTRRIRIAASGKCYSYDQVVGYELVEDTGRPRGFARAYSLGFLSSATPISAMKIRLELNSPEEPQVFVNLLITPTKSNTLIYKNLLKTAQDILEELRRTCPQKEAENRPFDYTEEIRRLSRLRDEGHLTDGEFEAKKKQILGI